MCGGGNWGNDWGEGKVESGEEWGGGGIGAWDVSIKGFLRTLTLLSGVKYVPILFCIKVERSLSMNTDSSPQEKNKNNSYPFCILYVRMHM